MRQIITVEIRPEQSFSTLFLFLPHSGVKYENEFFVYFYLKFGLFLYAMNLSL